MSATKLAKLIMKKWQTFPTLSPEEVGDLQEVFQHPLFLEGSEKERREIMLRSSQSKYKGEFDYPWDRYFGIDLSDMLKDKVALDLGCFTGGRTAAWFERYNLKAVCGVDVTETFIEAARQFAAVKKIPSEFRVATGEALPFDNESFDAILSFDVFEHVQDVQQALEECYRVLKPGGKLFVVFPSYHQPVEHHLGLVTNVPGIQYIFSGKTLVKAYYEILEERGPEAFWYKRASPYLKSWEKGNTINRTSAAQFRKYIKRGNWKVVLNSRKPIGSIGRNVSRMRLARPISRLLYSFTFLPGLEEILLHRITYILEKD